jgi:PAS domain S-box-containing protein
MSTNHSPFADIPLDDGELITWLHQAINEHAIMAVTDPDGVILHVNDRFCAISGYSREELVGQTHRIIRSDEHSPEFFAQLWQTLNAGHTWHGTFCNRAKDGHLYWVTSTIVPLVDDTGKPRFHLALRTDVSRLKHIEAELRHEHAELEHQVAMLHEKQDELAAFYDHAPIGISWREFDGDGQPTINHVNKRFCDIVGLTPEEAADMRNIVRITHPDDRAEQERLTKELYAGKRSLFSMEKRYLRPDGSMVWANLTVVVLREEDGRVTHHFGMLEDVNARIKATNELKSKEERWRTYLNTASEILMTVTPEGRIKWVSSAITSKLGYDPDSLMGRRFGEYLHPEDAPAWEQFFHDTLSHGGSANSIEYRVRHTDGHWIWHAMSASTYSDRNDRTAFLGVGRDIAARREAQDQLKAALARREEMERIVDRSPSVVVLWRAGDNWPVEFVSASVRQYGYEPEYFTSQNKGFIAITHPDDTARVTAELEAHATAGHDEYNQEYRIVCRDGSVRWVADHTVVRRDSEGVVTHHEGLITDITERKEVEEREKALRERDLRTAAEIQNHLLPHEFPRNEVLEIEALSHPSMLIGGDYYDVLKVGERQLGFVIADVSGKGAGAALVMTECRATMRLCAEGEPSPAAVLRRVNRVLQPDMRPGMFVALFYGIIDLDTKIMRFCRAGHEPPLLLHPTGEVDQLPGGGLAVGLDEGELFDEVLEEHEVQLAEGDLLALYTDGITEATNPQGEEFERVRLATSLERHLDRPLDEVVKTVDRYVRNFCVLEPNHDDRTLLLVRVL